MSKMRFMWAAALLALCVSLSAGGALAADSWAATSDTLPSVLIWNQGADASVTITNDGDTTFNSAYQLKSVEGITGAATLIERWGVTPTPLAISGTVAPDATYTFDFTITAPPIATMNYANGIGPTDVAVSVGLDCNFILANGNARINTDTVDNPIVINRFNDMVDNPATPSIPEDWANVQIHQLAGRVPLITQGYPDGTYRAFDAVDRGQMAVFMFRALKLATVPSPAAFSDVPVDFWANKEIAALVDTGIVTGYGDGTYRPAGIVDRATMAVFVARGLAGGESFVPTAATPSAFTDVPVDYWAYDHVMYCVGANVVGGYGDGTFRPTLAVDRGQMAVFVYRAFIQPTDSVVVLAGPGVTRNAAIGVYDGWSVTPSAPAVAYIAIDAVRMLADAAADVQFTVVDADDVVCASGAGAPADTVANVQASAAADGVPYLYYTFDLSGLAAGSYTVEVTVDGVLLNQVASFRIP